MKRPKIIDIRATTVTVPLEAPLRHANGAHWGRFVRTIVEVETDTGLVGLGEMGGGGEGAEASFRALKAYLIGHDPFELEAMRFKITNPTASLYNNRTQLHAASRVRLPRHRRKNARRAGLRPAWREGEGRGALRKLTILLLPPPGHRRGRDPHGRPN